MAFLDELKDMATDVAQVAGKKVNEAYSATKLKMELAEKQGALRNLYKELGEIVYNNIKQGDEEDAAGDIEGKIMEIDYALEEIARIKEEYGEVKNLRVCSSCGKSVSADFNFCPECGSARE